MTDWSLVLVPFFVAMMLALFRFVGCGVLLADPGAQPDPTTNIPPPPPDYGNAILAEPLLVAYWRLGEPAGTSAGATAKDEKVANPGTYQIKDLSAGPQAPETSHPPILSAGRDGLIPTASGRTSVRVNGGYVQVPFKAALNPPKTPGFSLEAWVHPEWSAGETGVFRCVVASREDTGAQKHGYILYAGPKLDATTFAVVDPTMHWQAWVGDGTTWRMLVGPKVVVDVTTYLVVIYEGAAEILTLIAMNEKDLEALPARTTLPTIYSPNPAAGAKPLYIGMGAPEAATPLYPFLGRIQEVAVYKGPMEGKNLMTHVQAAVGI